MTTPWNPQATDQDYLAAAREKAPTRPASPGGQEATMVRPRVVVFVPGQLVNPLNGAHGHWSTASRYRKTWRTKVHAAWLASGLRDQVGGPTVAKRVWLTAYTWNVLDHDGLVSATKPILDGLVDAGVLHSDAPHSGHAVMYSQQIRRGGRGVEITVEAR